MGKRIFIFLQVYFLSVLGYSQTTPPYSTLQRVIPPSPEAISIARVGFSDVNLYTGKASYSLPIYTISQNGISFPISLSYTGGGGIRVDEVGSSVGLGWNLTATGMVSRVIRGVADDLYVGNYIGYIHLPEFPPIDTAHVTDYTLYSENKYDGQPDLFSISVAGVNAQFYISKSKKIIFVEKSDLKVTPVFSGYSIVAFEVKDLYGRTYYFSELEKSKSEPVDDTYAEYEDYNTTSWYLKKITSEYGKDIISFTYLSGESNVIKQDLRSPYQYKVSYPYDQSNFIEDNTSFSHMYYKRPVLQKISFATGEVNFTMSDSLRYDMADDEFLKSIIVKNYLGDTIKQYKLFTSYFSTSGTIQQGQGTHSMYGNSALRLKLDSLQDLSKTNQKLTYKFIYETSVYLPDRMSSFAMDHWGYYNGATTNTGWEAKNRAKYYLQLGPFAARDSFYVENGTANRNPNITYAKAGVLKRVVLPTGGEMQFDYELHNSANSKLPNTLITTNFFSTLNYTPNYFSITLVNEPFSKVKVTADVSSSSYSYEYILADSTQTKFYVHDTLVFGDDEHEYKVEGGTYFVKVRVLGAHSDPNYQYFTRVYKENEQVVSNKAVGGLRIKAMRLVDSAFGTSFQRNYYYNESGDTSSTSLSTGEIDRVPSYGFQSVELYSGDSEPNYFSAFYVLPHGYSRVLTSTYSPGVTSGSNVGYRKVTVVDSNISRTESYFSSFKEFPEFSEGYFPEYASSFDELTMNGKVYETSPLAPFDERDYLRGKLLKQIIYRKENGVFQKIQQTENTYGFNMGFVIDRHTFMLPDTLELISGMLFNVIPHPGVSPSIQLKRYNLYTTKFDLKRVVEKQYSYVGSAVDSLVTQSDIYYGDSPWYIDSLYHYQPTKITKFTNSGSEVSKIYYPYHWRYDVPFADAAEEAKMQILEAANRIAVPVLQVVEDSATNYHVSSVKNTYNTFVSGKLAVNYIKTKIGSASTFDDNISFNRYDTLGNLIEQQKVNDVKSTYLWDHKNSFPVAEITNADSASVAYTSFEADGKGNWTYSGSNLDTIAITGKKAYKLTGSNNITKSGLSSGTVYFVSYWTRNSSAFTITGTQSGYPIAGRTVNGWKYFEHKITGQTTVTISGTGWIDELRLYPSNALMSTLTYTPLVGISSQCDANNRISYYEYDAFNRLTMIRDQDNNIIKRICYNYAGQAEECYVPPAAAPSTVSIQSNNYSAMSGYTALYTNVSTSQQTSFSVPSAGGLQTLGQLTPGTYNLTISKTGFQPTMIFGAGCNGYTISGTSATFYNIVITSSNCKTISIEIAE